MSNPSVPGLLSFLYLLVGTVEVAQGWTQVGGTLEGSSNDDWFGRALSLNDDGSRLVVGASLNDQAGVTSGMVSVYNLSYYAPPGYCCSV